MLQAYAHARAERVKARQILAAACIDLRLKNIKYGLFEERVIAFAGTWTVMPSTSK